jgi:predicted PurR-regulated permease PerM
MQLFLLLFIILIIVILAYILKPKIIEGATTQYDEYSDEDPLFLATKNAANISWLKDQLDNINTLSQQITDMSNNVALNTSNINDIQLSVSQYGQSLTGTSGDPNEEIPQATGLD